MNIIEKDINEIIPYVNNPRKNDDAVDKVAASIREFGFKVPCVISKDNVIVTGHTRIKAAKKLGMATVPCIVADDLTEAQIKAFRLVDNKVAEFSEWDFEKLGIEFEGLAEFDLDDFGFEIDEDSISFGGSSESAEDNPFDDIEKLEKHYGVPYQGNKSRIADIIINILPAGNRLVDLFGGGGVQSLIVVCSRASGIHSFITTSMRWSQDYSLMRYMANIMTSAE